MFNNYKKIFFSCLIIALLANVFVLAGASAQGIYEDVLERRIEELRRIGLPGAEESDFQPLDRVARIIRMLLSLTAMVFLVLMLYGGFRWMTAAGNQENIDKAKKIISSAVIGVIIVALSYAITVFVFNVLLQSRYYW